MKHHRTQLYGHRLRRLLAGLLCAAVMCGLLPGISLTGTAQAAVAQLAWSNQDLEDLHSYGIMNGDAGGMRPNDYISRAEFSALVNRSLGYKEKAAKVPFQDVPAAEWFYDDVSISYNMGYINGVTPTSAAPRATLSREEALVIMARNLMLQPTVGESFSFADARSFNEYSRGYIDPAIEAGLISADPYNNFSPRQAITRGEMAGMMNRAIGIPIQSAGVQSLGTVNGNVTITTPGVSLRNTTINGDLYLTAGIGLGDVLLDNVTVNGKIIDSGAGVSEKGEISVILNNVTADELIVDSMRNNTISLTARGNTLIPKTSLRTSSRVEDSTATNYGLRLVEVDGEEKTATVLSGNIKEVVNKTPNSTLNIGEGVAEKVTVDEAATGSSVTVGKDARIKYLNLDAGVAVTGSGGVDSLTVSANGASLNLPQMPDEIVITPGVTSNINKQQMDSAAAAEASSRPRLLPGYPGTDNLAPTSVTALFKTNKPGTIYWAITARADGSPSEENIISPPSYSNTIVRSGSVKAKASNTEYTAKISGLTSDGSYYLSVIMVDDKGIRSTMKVTAFTTPDNSTPAFSKGYPEESQISEKDAQFAFMTTKDCYLYYTVLPKGGTAPRAIDFKTGSISGNLGYGVVKMAKDSPAYIFVNDVSLEEKQSYVLYLWLNDIDGAKSSSVKSINFTTQDRTDPVVSNMRSTKSTTTSVTMGYSLNEAGTLYWAVVPAGDKTFMTPATGYNNSNWLTSRPAMERIVAGTGAVKSGRSTVAATKAGADVSFTASPLNSKTTGTSSYDLYYVAVDAAGNWSKPIKSVTIYTEDKTAPTVVQNFTSYNEGESATTTTPLADTSIKLIFSKPVGATDVTGDGSFRTFLDLYQGNQTDKETLARLLRYYIKLYEVPTTGNSIDKLVAERTDQTPSTAEWVIDYRYATVYLEGSTLVVEFPNGTALNLSNGTTYYFSFKTGSTNVAIRDSTGNNPMQIRELSKFTTKQAQVIVRDTTTQKMIPVDKTYQSDKAGTVEADFVFELDPRTTEKSPENVFFDIMLWCDANLTCDLYEYDAASGLWKRVTGDENAKNKVENGTQLGAFTYSATVGQFQYQSAMAAKRIVSQSPDYDWNSMRLKQFQGTHQYAVHIVTVNGSTARAKWNLLENSFRVTIAAATAQGMQLVMANNVESTWERYKKNNTVSSIGSPDPYGDNIPVSSTAAPELVGELPRIDASDTSAYITLQLDQKDSTVYYVVSQLEFPANTNVSNPTDDQWKAARCPLTETRFADNSQSFLNVPESGASPAVKVSTPTAYAVKTASKPTAAQEKRLIVGNMSYGELGSPLEIPLHNLLADSWYAVYLVFEKGVWLSTEPVCYKFKTDPAITPILTLSTQGEVNASVNATLYNTDANVTSVLLFDSEVAGSVLEDEFTSNGLSVLETLCKSTSSGNRTSLFDTLTKNTADKTELTTGKRTADQLRTEVEQMITNRSTLKWNNRGEAVVVDPDSKVVTVNMSHGLNSDKDRANSYVCLAKAENTSDETKRAFAAIDEVRFVDTNPTEVSGSTVNYGVLSTVDEGGTKYRVLEGSISLTYRNTLFYRGSDGLRPFSPCLENDQMDADDSSKVEYYGIKSVAGYSEIKLPNFMYRIRLETGAVGETDRYVLEFQRVVGGETAYPDGQLPNGWSTVIALPGFFNRNGFGTQNQGIKITYNKNSDTWTSEVVSTK